MGESINEARAAVGLPELPCHASRWAAHVWHYVAADGCPLCAAEELLGGPAWDAPDSDEDPLP